MSANAASNALYAVLDFGDNANSTTATLNGILASGNPSLSAASTAAIALGPACGFARPISS